MTGRTENYIGGPAITNQIMASWTEALVKVLESMTSHRSKIESRASASPEWEEGTAWWGQRLSILDKPSFWIGAPAKSWTELGRLTLAALGVEEPADSEIETTCRDVMAQTTAVVASHLTGQFGREITGGDSLPADRPDDFAAPVFKWSLDAGPISIDGVVAFSEAFLRQCSSFGEPPTAVESCTQVISPPTDHAGLTMGGRSMDSVPRIDLPVKFVLGRTTLPLRDVFKLSVGSVIELDRSAIEPADVLIHGRLLARGQVVVVDGNYGLKILPQQQ
jgi:flagellar motor switch protein FliN/FliY